MQELKHSHDALSQSNVEKEKRIEKERERFDSQTKELKQSLMKQYHDEIKHLQSSYMKKFDQFTDRSNNQSSICV